MIAGIVTMRRFGIFGLVSLAAGCNSAAFQPVDLPKVSGHEDLTYPRLVDTPAIPQDRLQREVGVLALARLEEEALITQTRVSTAPPVAPNEALSRRIAAIGSNPGLPERPVDRNVLTQRGAALHQDRPAATNVDRQLLIDRAAIIQNRADRAGSSINVQDLTRRAAAASGAHTRSAGVDRLSLAERAAQLWLVAARQDPQTEAVDAQRILNAAVAAADQTNGSPVDKGRILKKNSPQRRSEVQAAAPPLDANAIRKAAAARAQPLDREKLLAKRRVLTSPDEEVLEKSFASRSQRALDAAKSRLDTE